MDNILKFISNLSIGEIAIVIAILILISVVSFRKIYLRKKEKEIPPSHENNDGVYWNNTRLLEYFKNSQRDPLKYGYTIFSSPPQKK